MLLPPCVLL